MTSLDRLRQAMNPNEKGRLPVLSSEAVKASLGEYGVSAAEQLLFSAGIGTELNSDGSSLESISNHEICAEFEKDLATYKEIFASAGIAMPTLEELAAAGIDWVRLAELKEDHPNHDLVVAPLTINKDDLRKIVSAMTPYEPTATNPLRKGRHTKTYGDGLWISSEAVDNWDAIMTSTARDCKLPVASLDTGQDLIACLLPPQDESDHLNTSYDQMRQQGLTTITIPIYVAYQIKRIKQGQKLIDGSTWTWALGEFTSRDGVCAPGVYWNPGTGRLCVDWLGVGDSRDNLGVRSPVG